MDKMTVLEQTEIPANTSEEEEAINSIELSPSSISNSTADFEARNFDALSPQHDAGESHLFLSERRHDETTSQNGNGIDATSSSRPRGSLLSERIMREVREHQLRAAKRERRSCFSMLRQIFALCLGVFPVCVFALEMIPERCNLCLDHVELDTYFVVVALCGGFGAILYSEEFWDYSVARFMGGCVAALGSLFTMWMILQTIHGNLAFLLFFVGILGAMPGVLVYFVIKVVSDECYFSDVQDFEDEFTSLTKLRVVEA
mmetsp:Transcript_2941/g.5315  ORF Transcript_2941/g.5315 Transcript_2941/m.5315 type:complete len:259 (+) Transcript_2941:87-863(+)